jgi:hypothetical protein
MSGLFVLGVAAVCLLLSIDLLSVLARFLVEQQAGPSAVLRLLVSKVPWFLHLAMPVAAVFAVLVSGGRMARDSELKAAQAGGIPPRALLVPVLAWGLAVSAVAVVNNGMVEPRAERAYQAIIDDFLYGRPPVASERAVCSLPPFIVLRPATWSSTPLDRTRSTSTCIPEVSTSSTSRMFRLEPSDRSTPPHVMSTSAIASSMSSRTAASETPSSSSASSGSKSPGEGRIRSTW